MPSMGERSWVLSSKFLISGDLRLPVVGLHALHARIQCRRSPTGSDSFAAKRSGSGLEPGPEDPAKVPIGQIGDHLTLGDMIAFMDINLPNHALYLGLHLGGGRGATWASPSTRMGQGKDCQKNQQCGRAHTMAVRRRFSRAMNFRFLSNMG